MKIIPAIDLKDGNVVRLTRGDYKSAKIYSNDPADIARKWHSQGAAIPVSYTHLTLPTTPYV